MSGLDASLVTGSSVLTGAQAPGNGGNGIQRITSADGSVTIANPTGPTADLSVPASSGVRTVATYAALGALASGSFSEGQLAYVQSGKVLFTLVASTQSALANVRIAASGKAGFQWSRTAPRHPVWEVQATWAIDPTNSTGLASDDNSGVNSGAPLFTVNELSWRLANASISQATGVSLLSSQQAGDVPLFTFHVTGTNQLLVTGTATVLHSGTVTSFTPATYAPTAGGMTAADDASLVDNAVSGGSWTAAGALNKGVRIRRTNGTVIYAYALKDKGSNTLRTSQPCNIASLTTQPAFAANDTYNIEQLPQIISWTSLDPTPLGTKFVDVDWRSTGRLTGGLAFTNVYMSTLSGNAFNGFITLLQNCCIDTGAISFGGNTQVTMTCGAWKGTGAITYSLNNGAWNLEGNLICWQGCSPLMASGFMNFFQFNFYDCTNSGLCKGDTGGRYHVLGGIGGTGNTGKLVSMHQGSQFLSGSYNISSGAGGCYNSASSSDANPIQADGTSGTGAIPLTSSFNMVAQTG